MRFLIDENLPRHLKKVLNEIGRIPTDHEFDYLPPGSEDVDLKALAIQLDLVIITRDREFILTDAWLRTYLDRQISAVILTASLGGVGSVAVTLDDLERWFRTNWSRVEDMLYANSGPTVIRAYLDGRLQIDEP
jgi:predicted nuclease of predicted toxin-antitoxin system